MRLHPSWALSVNRQVVFFEETPAMTSACCFIVLLRQKHAKTPRHVDWALWISTSWPSSHQGNTTGFHRVSPVGPPNGKNVEILGSAVVGAVQQGCHAATLSHPEMAGSCWNFYDVTTVTMIPLSKSIPRMGLDPTNTGAIDLTIKHWEGQARNFLEFEPGKMEWWLLNLAPL